MKPEIAHEPYWLVTSTTGEIALVPSHLAPAGKDGAPPALATLELFLPFPTQGAEVEQKTGLLARLSAPGYLGSTEWTAFDTVDGLIEGFVNDYGVPEHVALAAAAEQLDLATCDLCGCLLPDQRRTVCELCSACDLVSPSKGLNADPDPMRIVHLETAPGFTLAMFDANERQGNKRGVAYVLAQKGESQPVFSSDRDGLLWSPDAIDGIGTVRSLLSFLTLRPGDTDAEYFERYTPEQRAFCEEYAESLACEASVRFGDD